MSSQIIPQVPHPAHKRFKDLTGQRFGRWTVLYYVGNNKHNQPTWLCRCDCGNVVVTSANGLRRGTTKSCGCRRSDVSRQSKNHFAPTHGMSRTPEFRVWMSMLDRCQNPQSQPYRHYGGRGIKVCERWQDFENFFADMGNRPSPKYSLDRIDNDGDYRPDNCRWATMKEQNSNRRSNQNITYNGQTHTIREWTLITGITYNTLWGRIFKSHWSIDRALTEQIHRSVPKNVTSVQ